MQTNQIVAIARDAPLVGHLSIGQLVQCSDGNNVFPITLTLRNTTSSRIVFHKIYDVHDLLVLRDSQGKIIKANYRDRTMFVHSFYDYIEPGDSESLKPALLEEDNLPPGVYEIRATVSVRNDDGKSVTRLITPELRFSTADLLSNPSQDRCF